MKIRYFFKGLGTGIIITTFILYFSYKNNISDADIILKAKNLGMVFAEDVSGQSIKIDEPKTTKIPSATKIPDVTKEPAITDKPVKTDKPEQTEMPAATETPSESYDIDGDDKNNEILKDEKISFTIKRGDWSRIVSENLENLGIVDDAKELDKYLVDKGYAVRIRVGTYEINKGASYEEIAKLITSK